MAAALDRVQLLYRSPSAAALLRGLRGDDEEAAAASGGGSAAAVALVDRVLVADAAGSRPRATDLTTADRDRVLAAIYMRAFGARVASTVRCIRCEARFDVDFSLRDLVRDTDARGSGLGADGAIALPDGRRYRLPIGADECAAVASADPVAALLERCALDGVMPGDAESVPPLMRAAAPVLDTDLAARCPDCSAEQSIRFDIQSYLLAALTAEGVELVHEIHRIAMAYGWSRAEILALPRERRRAHVALVDAEMRPRRRSRR